MRAMTAYYKSITKLYQCSYIVPNFPHRSFYNHFENYTKLAAYTLGSQLHMHNQKSLAKLPLIRSVPFFLPHACLVGNTFTNRDVIPTVCVQIYNDSLHYTFYYILQIPLIFSLLYGETCWLVKTWPRYRKKKR